MSYCLAGERVISSSRVAKLTKLLFFKKTLLARVFVFLYKCDDNSNLPVVLQLLLPTATNPELYFTTYRVVKVKNENFAVDDEVLIPSTHFNLLSKGRGLRKRF